MRVAVLKYIAEMKAHAAQEALEADRCRRQWRRLACVAFIMAATSPFIAAFMQGWALRAIVVSTGIAWVIAGRSNWKQGDLFARKWLELREQALRYAKDAETHI